MSGKVKMRCARCGKPFRSSNPKQTLCDSCSAQARNDRTANKIGAAKSAVTTRPTSAPKIVGPGAAILGVATVATPAPLAATTVDGELAYASGERRGQQSRAAIGMDQSGRAARAGQHHHGKAGTTERAQSPRSSAPAQEPKPRRPSTPPIVLTDELRARIEQRYTELARPTEFDGIRTQIAGELGVPKHLVKRAVLDLRTRTQAPSWWELRAYTGTSADLDRIRQAYLPHLPVPPVGIHKQIASDLHVEPLAVYQAIKRIRAEMGLPQFNPADLHAETAAPAVSGSEAATAGSADLLS